MVVGEAVWASANQQEKEEKKRGHSILVKLSSVCWCNFKMHGHHIT
jgi:hypothetical protein